ASVPNRPKESKLKKFVNSRIPITEWLPKYTKNDIVADFIAGLTVGLTMMPQSIAYAGLAGLSPQYGLYTAFIGSFTYIFFGTIKEVSIGPTSLMAIITQSYVDGLPIECVVLLTFMAGVVELLMGVFRLGFLVEFISSPITSGFTSASALIIILAQLKPLLGIKSHSHHFLMMVIEIFENISETRLPDVSLGVGCIIFLFAIKRISRIQTRNRNLRKSLWFLGISKNAICVFLTSLLGIYLHEWRGGAPFKLTGEVVQGLPSFSFPNLTAVIDDKPVNFKGMLESLGWGVIVVPFVAVLANVAIAKSYASDVVVDANQEMMTLGFCNLLGSCVQAMPSCGAFTRSAVASSSDVRTPLQGLYSASVIMLALSLLTPYFYYIPKATLAAVLITAASSLIDYEIFPKLWRTDKFDFLLTIFTFVVGVILGVEIAIVSGALINMIRLLKVWTRPVIFMFVRSDKQGREYLYLKPELGLYYPTADYLTEYIKKQHKNHKCPMALDCQNVLHIDYAGCKALETMLNLYNDKEVQLILLNVSPIIKGKLKTVLDKNNLIYCQSSNEICDNAFDLQICSDEEVPLTLSNGNNNDKLKERKLSLYDNV
ncbi:unnamed protein product, partial [Brassicogethes aeneus]